MKNEKTLMKFIRRVKFAATMFKDFGEFYNFVHDEKRFAFSRIMVKSDFDRLVSVAGVNLY